MLTQLFVVVFPGIRDPRFGRLAEAWRTERHFREHFTAMGIEDRLPVDVLVSALEEMATSGGDINLKLAVNLVLELADRCKSDQTSEESWAKHGQAYVPTSSGQLALSSSVFINDAPWSSSVGARLLHEKVPNDAGRVLGCTSVRDQLARECETTVDDIGEDFGQFEDLATRIRGLLRDYDNEFDVFTEHWQNSDDAGAERLLFLLDKSTYKKESLLSDKCDMLQGPSLVFASSKPLSDEDISRIQRLGNSSKRTQFAQAGRFGVGLSCL
jgi:hypothetical protein